MARVCCVAVVDPKEIRLLSAALRGAGESALAFVTQLDVVALRKLAPDILVADVDDLEVDPLEMLRQIRFVAPDCVLVVYTAAMAGSWARACHLAGASCVLSKASSEAQLTSGLRSAIRGGCFTDPRFAA